MLASLFTAQMSVPVVVVVFVLLCFVVLGLILWSIKRHRDPHLRIECDAPVSELIPSLAGLTHGGLLEGNAALVLENGRFFDAVFEEIAKASRSVHFETYLWKDGVLGRRLVAALVERCRAGVQVRVMVDANGGKKMGREARRQLRAGGCRLVMFHRKRLRNLGRLNRRDHRKLLVVDGRVAFVGGHCIVDSWLGDAGDKTHFRDLGLRLTGPVVNALQATFSENWIDETGELFVGEDVFPALEPAGDVAVHVASVKPEGSAPAVKILHHLAICLARERILIQNPYFLPKAAAIDALGRAVARGVDVRVMLPSAEASDMPIVQHAAHRNFARLLASGVRIFEYRKTLLHQKTIVVDGLWCGVGSSNFDERSFEINDEITLGLRSAALAGELEAVFERDAQDCVELKHASWIRRGWRHRLKDQALYLFSQQL
jgi:cardiolipin synthase